MVSVWNFMVLKMHVIVHASKVRDAFACKVTFLHVVSGSQVVCWLLGLVDVVHWFLMHVN